METPEIKQMFENYNKCSLSYIMDDANKNINLVMSLEEQLITNELNTLTESSDINLNPDIQDPDEYEKTSSGLQSMMKKYSQSKDPKHQRFVQLGQKKLQQLQQRRQNIEKGAKSALSRANNGKSLANKDRIGGFRKTLGNK